MKAGNRMISRKQYETICEKVLKFFEKASIAITEDEKKKIEVADFGLNDIEITGDESIHLVD